MKTRMNHLPDRALWTRRALFQHLGCGVGSMALAAMLAEDSHGDEGASDARHPLAPKPSHHAAKATSIIHIHLVGAPSHLDLFDYKPRLQERSGEPCPAELFEGKKFAFIRERPTLLGTPTKPEYAFRRCGDAGTEISGLLPHLQGVADELTVVRSLHTNEINHGPAQLFMLTGFGRFGRPSIGSWVNYGLGTVNQDLPGFVVMQTGLTLGAGSAAWSSGFLPSVYQGVTFRSKGDPVLFLSNPSGVENDDRRQILDTVNELNRVQLADLGDPEIATRIEQYEMAFRMQRSVPELVDFSDESSTTLELYGATPGKVSFANHCLLARRLVERGVRFVQLFDEGWDMHGSVFNSLPKKCREVDQPIAALIKDLRQRGLLDKTLVVWSAEFGRTPMAQGRDGQGKDTSVGRDHHKDAFTVWMAGGGGRPGYVHGATDELGYAVVENPVHVHDWNATLMHLMGMDHERLTFRFQGRQFRLTDIHGKVIRELIA